MLEPQKIFSLSCNEYASYSFYFKDSPPPPYKTIKTMGGVGIVVFKDSLVANIFHNLRKCKGMESIKITGISIGVILQYKYVLTQMNKKRSYNETLRRKCPNKNVITAARVDYTMHVGFIKRYPPYKPDIETLLTLCSPSPGTLASERITRIYGVRFSSAFMMGVMPF